jgi:hypothetical protein
MIDQPNLAVNFTFGIFEKILDLNQMAWDAL